MSSAETVWAQKRSPRVDRRRGLGSYFGLDEPQDTEGRENQEEGVVSKGQSGREGESGLREADWDGTKRSSSFSNVEAIGGHSSDVFQEVRLTGAGSGGRGKKT